MKPTEKAIHIHIDGISCINCCNKIEKALYGTDGVISVNLSYETQIADIVYNPTILSIESIYSVIRKIGYEISETKNPKLSNTLKTINFLSIIICLYVIFKTTGILNYLVPGDLVDSEMGYGMLFIIGLATSVHCIAMCGGINLSQCIPKSVNDTGKISAFVPTLLYNFGRVISYTLIGWIMGFIGFLFGGNSDATIPVFLQGLLKIFAGIFMVIMGLNMLGILPQLRRFIPKMPKHIAKNVGSQKAKHRQPFIVGLLNGIMPCGPLYSMHIVALASANPLVGGVSMLMFSLGTVPLMLGFGSIVSALGREFTYAVNVAGSILVTVMGLAMLSQGGSLSGIISPDMIMLFVLAISVIAVISSINFRKSLFVNMATALTAVAAITGYALFKSGVVSIPNGSSAVEDNITIEDGVQVVNSTITSGTYPSITVKSGIPVKWIIDAPEGTLNGCNYSIIINEFDIKYDFHTGENIIEFTPAKSGTYQYTCWMGMIKANITVT